MSDDVKEVEIVDNVAPVNEEITIDSLNVLDPVEKDMAIKNKFVVEKKEDKEVVTKDDKQDQKIVENKNDITFDDVEKNEKDLIKNYNKNEQALYWKWKHDKKERQIAQREYELSSIREKSLKSQLEQVRNDSTISGAKLKKINELLTGNADDITVEALQEILKENVSNKDDDKDKPLTRKDLEELDNKKKEEILETDKKQDFIRNRVDSAEKIGRTKYEDYDRVINLAEEIINGKVELPDFIDSKELSTKLVNKITDKDVDVEKVADLVYSIAKLNPNFSKDHVESKKEVRKETNENIDRILKNANKPQSSASISGGNGKRMVSVDDLTMDDVANMSIDQYSSLPERIRRKFL